MAIKAPVAFVAVPPPPVMTDLLGSHNLYLVPLVPLFLKGILVSAHFTTLGAFNVFVNTMTVFLVSS